MPRVNSDLKASQLSSSSIRPPPFARSGMEKQILEDLPIQSLWWFLISSTPFVRHTWILNLIKLCLRNTSYMIGCDLKKSCSPCDDQFTMDDLLDCLNLVGETHILESVGWVLKYPRGRSPMQLLVAATERVGNLLLGRRSCRPPLVVVRAASVDSAHHSQRRDHHDLRIVGTQIRTCVHMRTYIVGPYGFL